MRTSRYDAPPDGSYYEATAGRRPDATALAGAVACDVAVVGAGYTGLSTALHLARRGYAVRVLEAHRVGWGASGRNGGQVGSGQRRVQSFLERLVGREEAQRLWRLGEDAKALVRALVDAHAIDCELAAGVMNVAHRPSETADLHREAAHLAEHYGYDRIHTFSAAESRQWVDAPGYHGGMLDRGAMHLHPLNFCLGLARAAVAAGAVLHEGALVQAVEPAGDGVAVTAGGATVTAKHAVLAGNGYIDTSIAPALAAKVLPLSNYILATAPLLPEVAGRLIVERAAVADTRNVVNYFRLTPDNRLLFGGGESYGRTYPDDIGGFVRRRMAAVFPHLATVPVTHAWGGTLAITVQRMPGFGRLHGGRVLYAHGFSGHGVAMGTLAGQLVAEAVAGTAERFEVMARLPQPDFPGGTALRWPIQVLAMLYFGLRDRL